MAERSEKSQSDSAQLGEMETQLTASALICSGRESSNSIHHLFLFSVICRGTRPLV